MATKTTKKTTKKVEEVKEVLPESPDAADALASTAWVSVAKNVDLAKEAKDEPAVVVAKKTPDEEFEAEYGKVMRDRDQTGLLSAILKELFLLRNSRG
jgi:hypothetical protein